MLRQIIFDRTGDYPAFNEEFSSLKSDTIVVVRHQNAIITLKPEGQTAQNIEIVINTSCHQIPKKLFKSITFNH